MSWLFAFAPLADATSPGWPWADCLLLQFCFSNSQMPPVLADRELTVCLLLHSLQMPPVLADHELTVCFYSFVLLTRRCHQSWLTVSWLSVCFCTACRCHRSWLTMSWFVAFIGEAVVWWKTNKQKNRLLTSKPVQPTLTSQPSQPNQQSFQKRFIGNHFKWGCDLLCCYRACFVKSVVLTNKLK